MQGTTVLKTIMGLSERGICCAVSLYTGNELEKCLVLVLMLFSYLNLQCLYESGLIYNDTFVFKCGLRM